MAGKSLAVKTIFLAIDKVTKVAGKIGKKISGFSKNTQKDFKQTGKSGNRLGAGLKKAFSFAAILAIVATLGTAIKDVVDVGKRFEKTMAGVSAKFGDLDPTQFSALEETARKFGATTEFSAGEAAKGLEYLAMAGFSVEESITAIPSVLNLATASGLGLARASDIASDTLGAFSLNVEDLTRVTDVMAKTATSSNVDLECMFETFKTAGPIASSLGVSIETVSALTGKLGDSGIKGSVAGTTLKNVFLSLAAPSAAAEKSLTKMGVATTDSAGNFRDTLDIFADLDKSLSTLGKADKSKVLKDIFGKIPIAGVNALLNTGVDNIKTFQTTLENAQGAASAMAETMRNNVEGRIASFNSALSDIKITGFKILEPIVSNLISGFTSLVITAGEWLRKNEDMINSNISIAFQYLSSILISLSGVGAVVIDIFKQIGGKFKETAEKSKLFQNIKSMIDDIVFSITMMWEALKDSGAIDLLTAAIGVVITVVSKMLKIVGQAIKIFARFFAGITNTGMFKGIVKTLTNIYKLIEGIISFMADNVISKVLEGFDWLFGGHKDKKKKKEKKDDKDEESDPKNKSYSSNPEKSTPDKNPSNLEQSISSMNVSPQTQLIRQEQYKQTNTKVDVNFNNPPNGTSIHQKEEVPGFNLNLGYNY